MKAYAQYKAKHKDPQNSNQKQISATKNRKSVDKSIRQNLF